MRLSTLAEGEVGEDSLVVGQGKEVIVKDGEQPAS